MIPPENVFHITCMCRNFHPYLWYLSILRPKFKPTRRGEAENINRSFQKCCLYHRCCHFTLSCSCHLTSSVFRSFKYERNFKRLVLSTAHSKPTCWWVERGFDFWILKASCLPWMLAVIPKACHPHSLHVKKNIIDNVSVHLWGNYPLHYMQNVLDIWNLFCLLFALCQREMIFAKCV